MDYKIYALLARASYCKDSSGIILDFEEKAKANLSAIKDEYKVLNDWEVVCRLGETQRIN